MKYPKELYVGSGFYEGDDEITCYKEKEKKMKDDLLWQAMQRIEIKAIEDKINAYIALAKKLDYPHVVIRMIIELEDELASMQEKYYAECKKIIDGWH